MKILCNRRQMKQYRADLVAMIRSHFKIHIAYAEVGVWAGETAKYVYHEVHPRVTVLIDQWQPWHSVTYRGVPYEVDWQTTEAARQWTQYIFKDCKNVVTMRGLSTTTATVLYDTLDVICIDSDHSYDMTRRELPLYWQALRSGGILCGHDYHKHFGVIPAVNEFAYLVWSPIHVYPSTFWHLEPKP